MNYENHSSSEKSAINRSFSILELVKRFLAWFMVAPAFKNKLSQCTEEATTEKCILACLYNNGNTFFMSSHCSNGSTDRDVIGLAKYKVNSSLAYTWFDFFFFIALSMNQLIMFCPKVISYFF